MVHNLLKTRILAWYCNWNIQSPQFADTSPEVNNQTDTGNTEFSKATGSDENGVDNNGMTDKGADVSDSVSNIESGDQNSVAAAPGT